MRINDLGGQVAVNLSTSVTDIVTLTDAAVDPRWPRATALGLRQITPDDMTKSGMDVDQSATQAQKVEPGQNPAVLLDRDVPDPPLTLSRGTVVDLPAEAGWQLSVRWDVSLVPSSAVDVVAFAVDESEQVVEETDFCFFNNLSHPSGAIELSLETPGEAIVDIRPDALPSDRRRVIVAAALEGPATFGDLGPIELVLRAGDGSPHVRSVLDASSTETTLILATIYDRGGTWRVRSVGQGFETDLASLAVQHGVDVSEE